jgi:alkylated DNA repair dioxygenase AlkB
MSNNIEYVINKAGAIVVVVRGWLDPLYSTTLHTSLVSQLKWVSAKMTFFNKSVDIPRQMFFLGDANVKTYKYSRLSFDVESWDNADSNSNYNSIYCHIRNIRDKISNDPLIQHITHKPIKFDSCLLNLYRNGADKIDQHSDKEAMGDLNAVVTVSLGTSRKITFKSKTKDANGKYEKIETMLNNGDMLLMLGECQNLWTHGICRETSVKDSRISLTFRLIKK